MTTDERALATWLASRDDAQLADTFALRSVGPMTSWHDFFDAAAGLLDAASVDRALTRLPRHALVALAAGSGADQPALTRLALVAPDGTPYAVVADRVAAAKAAAPEAFEEATDASALPRPADDAATAAAAERVLATTGALADLLIATQHTPLARTGTGTVSAVDRKRLVEAGAIASPEELDDLVQAAGAAQLLESPDREWIASDEADAWLEASTTERWTHVVTGFRNALRPGLRTATGGYLPPTAWGQAYPLDPEWQSEAVRLQRIAVRWALVTPEGTEPGWAEPLRAGSAPDAAALAALLPPEIDKVYLQAD